MLEQPRGLHAKRHRQRRWMRRGSVLVVSYFVLSILILLSIPQTMRSLSSVRLEQRFVDVRQSWQLADGAIDAVARGMLAGTIPTPTSCPTPSVITLSPTQIGAMSYTGTIEAPSCSAISPMDRTYKMTMTSTGPLGSQKTFEAMVELTHSPMRRAVFSNGSLVIGTDNEFTDSYNSTTGIVCNQVTQSPPCRGDVETHSDAPGAIQIGTQSVIAGTAFTRNGAVGSVNPSYSVSCPSPGPCIQAQPDSTATYQSKAPPARPPCLNDGIHTKSSLVTYSSPGLFTDNNYYCFDGGLAITGNNALTFQNVPQLYVGPPGLSATSDASIHWYNTNPTTVQTNNLTVSGTGGLQITGKTDWYVTGSVSLAAHGVNSGGIPNNFRLYVRPDPTHINPITGTTTDSVSISGSGNDFYGVLYAPELPVTMDLAAQLWGAVVANTFSMSGHAAHVRFDEALLNVTDLPFPTGGNGAGGIVRVRAIRSPR